MFSNPNLTTVGLTREQTKIKNKTPCLRLTMRLDDQYTFRNPKHKQIRSHQELSALHHVRCLCRSREMGGGETDGSENTGKTTQQAYGKGRRLSPHYEAGIKQRKMLAIEGMHAKRKHPAPTGSQRPARTCLQDQRRKR